MKIEIDEDVKSIAEFMQSNVPAKKLIWVARQLAQIAPVLWDHFNDDGIAAIRLYPEMPTMIEHKQAVSIGSLPEQ